MKLNIIAIINLGLIITHQIDAAYWHEWDMFHMPGGIQFFNFLSLAIFIILLICFQETIRRTVRGYYGSLLLALGGSLIFFFHTGFALLGYTQFNLPLSIAVIVSSFPVSVTQLILTLRSRAEFKTSET